MFHHLLFWISVKSWENKFREILSSRTKRLQVTLCSHDNKIYTVRLIIVSTEDIIRYQIFFQICIDWHLASFVFSFQLWNIQYRSTEVPIIPYIHVRHKYGPYWRLKWRNGMWVSVCSSFSFPGIECWTEWSHRKPTSNFKLQTTVKRWDGRRESVSII